MEGLTLKITGMEEGLFRLMDFHGNETISCPYQFQLDVLVPNEKDHLVDFSKMLGQRTTVTLPLSCGKARHFDGICGRVTRGDRDSRYTAYSLELVPKLWLLKKRAGCRIFQNKSIPQILEEVLGELDIEFDTRSLSGCYKPRNYCVQYRETDFNFISRLMEQEGIYYSFRHSDGRHQMMLMDEGRDPCISEPVEVLYGGTLRTSGESDRILSWQKTQELRPGKYSLRDYSFKNPENDLHEMEPALDVLSIGKTEHKLIIGGNDQLEIYDYSSEFAHRFDDKSDETIDDIRRTARIRIDEETLAGLIIRGTSTCARFTCGHVFEKRDADGHEPGGEYLLTSVEHSAQSRGFEAGETTGVYYQNSFDCIYSSPQLPFRPPRLTSKPLVHGTQTALVDGPEGEEIHTDEFGRVKVKFHWDRDGLRGSGETSCWVRVGTPWAGQRWGMVHIPRVGQEVIVAFQEGDPDQPLIIGSVYNAVNEPPYKLPCNKTQSGIKTLSTKEGSIEKHFNEFRFEDKKDEEEIYLHAERDFNRVIEGAETVRVGGGDKGATDQTVVVSGNRTLTIETGDQTVMIQQGSQITKLDLGKVETEAMQSIELKVGENSIKIDQMGITLKGMSIKLDSELLTDLQSNLATKVNGSAMLKLNGGLMTMG